ncbi:MAG: HpsJ family protein [Prochlorococcus sp.]|nr:HpsJ family protein [Prochlorococcaceae cyanobacterium Fu_MAG_50]
MGSKSSSRLSSLLRWLGLTLIILLFLQIAVLLTGSDWSDQVYQQLVIERLVNQAPMAFVGLLLMLIGSRLDQPGQEKSLIRWLVCGLSALLAVLMIAVIPIAITGNQTLSGEADQGLQQKRDQLEMARQQGKNPEAVQMLGEQLAQAGQLPAGASDEDKQKAAQQFIDRQLGQMDDQIQRVEKQRNLAASQRFFGGTLTAVVLAVAFVLLAFTSVL